MKTTTIAPTDRYEIRPPFLFRWEDSQQAHVLLYPEGIVKLNATAGDILKRCDGSTSVVELIEQLGCDYNASAIDAIRAGVLNFLRCPMPRAGSELRLDGSGNPVWLLLELTYQCPLQCVFCSNPRNFADYRRDELSTDEWIDVMAQARAMGAVQIGFSGGEPTLRKDLETLVAEADRMGYYTNLITSGIGLTEARLRALKDAAAPHSARLSIHRP